MKSLKKRQIMREAVGVFDTLENLDAAVVELEALVARHDISVLGSSKDLQKKFGEHTIASLEDNPQVPRNISIRPEERMIGSFVLIGFCAYVCGTISAVSFGMESSLDMILSLAVGSLAGAALGSLAVFFIGKKMNQDLKEKIRQGGLLLWVRISGPDIEESVTGIMRKHAGRRIHTHNIV